MAIVTTGWCAGAAASAGAAAIEIKIAAATNRPLLQYICITFIFARDSLSAIINGAFELQAKGASNFPLLAPRDCETALHRRPRQTTFKPGGHALQLIEIHEVARTVVADQIAHPTECCDVGNGV